MPSSVPMQPQLSNLGNIRPQQPIPYPLLQQRPPSQQAPGGVRRQEAPPSSQQGPGNVDSSSEAAPRSSADIPEEVLKSVDSWAIPPAFHKKLQSDLETNGNEHLTVPTTGTWSTLKTWLANHPNAFGSNSMEVLLHNQRLHFDHVRLANQGPDLHEATKAKNKNLTQTPTQTQGHPYPQTHPGPAQHPVPNSLPNQRIGQTPSQPQASPQTHRRPIHPNLGPASVPSSYQAVTAMPSAEVIQRVRSQNPNEMASLTDEQIAQRIMEYKSQQFKRQMQWQNVTLSQDFQALQGNPRQPGMANLGLGGGTGNMQNLPQQPGVNQGQVPPAAVRYPTGAPAYPPQTNQPMPGSNMVPGPAALSAAPGHGATGQTVPPMTASPATTQPQNLGQSLAPTLANVPSGAAPSAGNVSQKMTPRGRAKPSPAMPKGPAGVTGQQLSGVPAQPQSLPTAQQPAGPMHQPQQPSMSGLPFAPQTHAHPQMQRTGAAIQPNNPNMPNPLANLSPEQRLFLQQKIAGRMNPLAGAQMGGQPTQTTFMPFRSRQFAEETWSKLPPPYLAHYRQKYQEVLQRRPIAATPEQRQQMTRCLEQLSRPLSIYDEILKYAKSKGEGNIQQMLEDRALLIQQYKEIPLPNNPQAAAPQTGAGWVVKEQFTCSFPELMLANGRIVPLFRQFHMAWKTMLQRQQTGSVPGAPGGIPVTPAPLTAMSLRQHQEHLKQVQNARQAQGPVHPQVPNRPPTQQVPVSAVPASNTATAPQPLAQNRPTVPQPPQSVMPGANPFSQQQPPAQQLEQRAGNVVRPAIAPAVSVPPVVARKAAEANAATDVVKQSPHGIPQYTGPSPVTRDKLVLPATKKRKTQSTKKDKERKESGVAQEGQPQVPALVTAPAATPRTTAGGVTPSPHRPVASMGAPDQGPTPRFALSVTPGSVTTPAVAPHGLAAMHHYKCAVPTCTHHIRGFASQQILDAHVAAEHRTEILPSVENGADYFFESLDVVKKKVEAAHAQREEAAKATREAQPGNGETVPKETGTSVGGVANQASVPLGLKEVTSSTNLVKLKEQDIWADLGIRISDLRATFTGFTDPKFPEFHGLGGDAVDDILFLNAAQNLEDSVQDSLDSFNTPKSQVSLITATTEDSGPVQSTPEKSLVPTDHDKTNTGSTPVFHKRKRDEWPTLSGGFDDTLFTEAAAESYEEINWDSIIDTEMSDDAPAS
ncbi:hypothetical protein KEM56_006525 [Ascosphaera pollenicola]|nr:hypothetical protein KEM56_006525 [Ascosphaera pollenicola]